MNDDDEFEFEEFDFPAEFENDEELSRFQRMSPRSRVSAPRPIVPRVNAARIAAPRPRPILPRRPGFPRPIAGRRIYLYAPDSPAASEYVRWVQTMLNQVLNLQLPVDGVMSTQTRSAIRSFQEKNGLTVTGIVGPDTERALLAARDGQAPGTDATKSAGPATVESPDARTTSSAPGITQPAEPATAPPSSEFDFEWGSFNDEFEARLATPVSTTTCLPYQKGEVEKSKTQAGFIPSDVIEHARGLLIADFGVDWRTPKSSVKDNSILKKWLTTIMEVIRANPTTKIRILGFSDCVGKEKGNGLLRRGRARRVHQLLYQLLRASPQWKELNTRITYVGAAPAGEYVADNGTVEGRAQNRGVLIEHTREVTFEPHRVPPAPPLCRVPSGFQDLIKRVRDSLRTYTPLLGLTGVKLPTTVRCLNAAEHAEATKVFGASLDFSKILIADGVGFQGRPFTVAVRVAGSFYVVMLVGARPSYDTLIHELTHAWQSQHAGDPSAFMKNSVSCQAGALKLAAALAILAPLPGYSTDDVSAYAYIPGKSFGEYAAEQIAQQVEDSYSGVGRPTPGIVTVIRSAPANTRDPGNEASLKVISYHRKSTPGVVFH
jgi:outer membrane protein OmpA-like peptidoglycan-associated protein